MANLVGNFSKYKDPLWYMIKHYTSDWEDFEINRMIKDAIKNPLTTLKIIKDNSETEYYDFRSGVYTSRNPNITEEYLDENYEILKVNEELYSDLSSNLNISLDYIEDIIGEKWDFRKIAMRSDLTFDFVKKHYIFFRDLDKECWYYISKNPTVTLKDVKENFLAPWNIKGLAHNPNIVYSDYEDNVFFGRDHYYEFIANCKISIDELYDILEDCSSSDEYIIKLWYVIAQNGYESSKKLWGHYVPANENISVDFLEKFFKEKNEDLSIYSFCENSFTRIRNQCKKIYAILCMGKKTSLPNEIITKIVEIM